MKKQGNYLAVDLVSKSIVSPLEKIKVFAWDAPIQYFRYKRNPADGGNLVLEFEITTGPGFDNTGKERMLGRIISLITLDDNDPLPSNDDASVKFLLNKKVMFGISRSHNFATLLFPGFIEAPETIPPIPNSPN